MTKLKTIKDFTFAFLLLAIGFVSCEDSERYDDFTSGELVSSTDIPVASFDYVIEDKVITFSNNSVNADAFEWQFDDDNEVESTDIDPVYDFGDDASSATVILSARNSNSNVTNETELKEILFLEANFIVAEFDLKLLTFENTSVEAVSFAWDFGDGNTSTEENPTHEFADFGDQIVSLTVTDIFGNEETFVNDEIVVAEPGAGTFEAVIIGGDPDDSSSTSQWAIDPDNSSGYNYWVNDPLEDLVEMLASAQQKINNSSSAANTGTNSWQIKDPSERFYQAINVEQGVDYTISLFTSSDADAGQTIGTWYVLSEAPADEDISTLETLAIASVPVTLMSDNKNDFEEVTISFNTGENTFSFTEEQLTNNENNLTSNFTEDSQFVILYFVPNTTIINEEGNKDDVYVDDISIFTRGF